MKKRILLVFFIIPALLGLYLTIAWLLRTWPFSTNYQIVRVYFDNVNGLKRADPVVLFGFEIGSVQGFEQQKNGVVVLLGIEPTVELYADASAEIQIKEILGGKQVALFPGKKTQLLDNKSILKGKQTFDITTGIAKMGNLLTELTPERTQQLWNSLDKITQIVNNIPEQQPKELLLNLSNSITGINNLLNKTNQFSLISKITSLIVHIDSTLQVADAKINALEPLMQAGTSTLNNMDTVLKNTDKLIYQAENLLLNAKSILDTLQQRQTLAHTLLYDTTFTKTVQETLDNLNKTMVHVRRKKIHVTMSFSHKQKKEYPENE
ncbi:MAG: MlaD family protein [Bacteroidia bacterium]|nr:MlaD family protein [Bacteroidia bacterium]